MADFIDRNDAMNRWGNLITSFKNLPGLRAVWPMTTISSTSAIYDQSGLNKILTRSGTPTLDIDNWIPFMSFNGTTDYLSRADEADLDIGGNESYINANINGLTMGGWFRQTTDPSAQRVIIGKGFNAPSKAYRIYSSNTLAPTFEISTDGTNIVTIASSTTISLDEWYFIVGRFIPSTEIKIWVNAQKDTSVAGIPATIFNSGVGFGIASDGVQFWPGDASISFLCCAALPDAIINSLYEQSKVLFRR
jgi:hypothetical protein